MKELKSCPHCGNRPDMEVFYQEFNCMLTITIACPLCCPSASKVGIAMSLPSRIEVPYDDFVRKFMKYSNEIVDFWNEKMSKEEERMK